jgi:hypothetical protein
MARPTKYTEKLVASAREYITTFEEHGHAVPSVVGLCDVIDIGKSTAYDWAEDKDKEFSDILERINQKQELVTFNKALRGDYNATIAKLLLGKHGYHDKVDNELTGKGGAPINLDLVVEFIIPDESPSTD